MRRLRLAAFAILTLLIMAAGGCRKEKKASPTVAPPVKVRVLSVGQADGVFAESRQFSGTVKAATTTLLSFAVGGTITELNVEEGGNVSAGTIIGKVKSGDYENANNITQAELAEARDAYERMKKLHDNNALPEIKWVEAEQKLRQAENAAKLSERTLSEATLKAPISGTVNRKLASKGQNVMPGEPVCEIISTGNLTIDISVPESEIGDYAVGQVATVDFKDERIGSFTGHITQRSVGADPLTRAFTVKVSLPSGNKRIMPGMVGTVSFLQPTKVTAGDLPIILPPRAVQLDADNRNFVWLVRDGRAERQFVEADELISDGVLIKSGLQTGDSVIIDGMRKVGTGSRVVVQQ